jgi:hypothetical protein
LRVWGQLGLPHKLLNQKRKKKKKKTGQGEPWHLAHFLTKAMGRVTVWLSPGLMATSRPSFGCHNPGGRGRGQAPSGQRTEKLPPATGHLSKNVSGKSAL